MSNTPTSSSGSDSPRIRDPRMVRRLTRRSRNHPYPPTITESDLANRLRRFDRRINAMSTSIQRNSEHLQQETIDRVNQADAMDTFEDRLGATIDMAEILDNRMDVTTAAVEAVRSQSNHNSQEIEDLRARMHLYEARLRETDEVIRMTGRLAESVDHLTALLPQLNLRRD